MTHCKKKCCCCDCHCKRDSLEFYYYVRDPSKQENTTTIPNRNPQSSYKAFINFTTQNIYDFDNNIIGVVKVFNNSSVFGEDMEYYTYQFNFYFNENKSAIVSNYPVALPNKQTSFEAGVPLNMTIDFASGEYLTKKGIVSILPFDDEKKTRKVTILFK